MGFNNNIASLLTYFPSPDYFYFRVPVLGASGDARLPTFFTRPNLP